MLYLAKSFSGTVLERGIIDKNEIYIMKLKGYYKINSIFHRILILKEMKKDTTKLTAYSTEYSF